MNRVSKITELMSAWICLSSSTCAIFSWSKSSISCRNSFKFFSSFSAALTSCSKRCFSRSKLSVFCLFLPEGKTNQQLTCVQNMHSTGWQYLTSFNASNWANIILSLPSVVMKAAIYSSSCQHFTRGLLDLLAMLLFQRGAIYRV